jgi:hypothetical protein
MVRGLPPSSVDGTAAGVSVGVVGGSWFRLASLSDGSVRARLRECRLVRGNRPRIKLRLQLYLSSSSNPKGGLLEPAASLLESMATGSFDGVDGLGAAPASWVRRRWRPCARRRRRPRAWRGDLGAAPRRGNSGVPRRSAATAESLGAAPPRRRKP